MPYVPVNCTSCGGEIQLDNTKEFGYCLHCGTKVYFQEAIQKIELINLPKVENLMMIATSEFENRHFAEAIQYFNRVLELDADNWKAILYKALSQCYETPIEGYSIRIAVAGANKAFNLAKKQINYELARTHFLIPIDNIISATISFPDELGEYFSVSADVNNILRNDAFYKSLETYPNFGNYLFFCVEGYEYCVDLLKKFPNSKDDLIIIYKKILFLINWFFEDFGSPQMVGALPSIRKQMVDKLDKYEEVLDVLDPQASNPVLKQKEVEKEIEKAKACYIATAVYGSCDAPQVLVLRRYRDYSLLTTPLGRIFVKIYYWISPSIAKSFHGKTNINNLVKLILDRIIENILL